MRTCAARTAPGIDVRSGSPTNPPAFPVPEAAGGVIVHHPHSLHESVADRGPHKCETPMLQIPAQQVRFRGSRGDLPSRFPGVEERLSAYEPPEVGIEAAEFLLYSQ